MRFFRSRYISKTVKAWGIVIMDAGRNLSALSNDDVADDLKYI